MDISKDPMQRRMAQVRLDQQDMSTKLGKRYREIRRGRGFAFTGTGTGHEHTPDRRLGQLNPGAHRVIGLGRR